MHVEQQLLRRVQDTPNDSMIREKYYCTNHLNVFRIQVKGLGFKGKTCENPCKS